MNTSSNSEHFLFFLKFTLQCYKWTFRFCTQQAGKPASHKHTPDLLYDFLFIPKIDQDDFLWTCCPDCCWHRQTNRYNNLLDNSKPNPKFLPGIPLGDSAQPLIDRKTDRNKQTTYWTIPSHASSSFTVPFLVTCCPNCQRQRLT